MFSKSIITLPKVGPKYKKLLEKLEIRTIGDLLYHFPFRYEDYSKIKKVAELEEGDVVSVAARLETISNIYTKHGKRLTRAKIEDHTGEIDVVWFNQHYLAKTLKPQTIYFFSGKVGSFGNKLCLVSPDFEEKREVNINTARLVPIYPETAGLSSKWLRARISDVVSGGKKFEEFLPETTLKKHNLTKIDPALRTIHFPESEIDAKKARHRFAFEELFLELLRVESRKESWNEKYKANPLKKEEFDKKLQEFVQKLPFKLTTSQENAVEEILSDLQKDHPMNRLLEGDVGTGKTIVAIISAYLTYLNGYKSIYLAPTEILAQQHYETFKNLLEPLGVKFGLKTSNSKETDADIIIGTHAILYSKEKYSKVGLVVIDEQHRFGVEQRAKVLQLGTTRQKPHLLTMTATPIPRTLALTLYGDLAISTLKTSPNKNKKITTKVIPERGREKAYEWIKNRGEQAFIVCPLIDESESETLENVKAAQVEYENLRKSVFAGESVGLLHGRMKPAEKQKVVEEFKTGKIKVLVSTPVIEVGIDVPEAAIMVIESAERYGLASLHQLRGRVGRGEKEGFCFVFMSSNSKSGYERLKYLESVDTGLELAEIDMKLRGHGDIYGTRQHGFKKFKVADIYNVEMLEKAKKEAEIVFPVLDRYPRLEEQIFDKIHPCFSHPE
jgi:ATP-dependent DNA helicase RecG